MTIYVDHLRFHPHKRKRYAHMVADTLSELHTFAEQAGIKRCWFDRNHYDLNPKNHEAALAKGAQLVESKIVATVRKRLRDEASKRNRS